MSGVGNNSTQEDSTKSDLRADARNSENSSNANTDSAGSQDGSNRNEQSGRVHATQESQGDTSPNTKDSWDAVSDKVSTLAGILAPTTALTAVLYYYGYVATSSRLAYFGIDIKMLNMATDEIILRSAAVVFAPLAVLLGVGIGLTATARLTDRALRAETARNVGWHRTLLRTTGLVAVSSGILGLGRGAAGIINPQIAKTEFPGLTPFSLGIGVMALSYGLHILAGTRMYPVQRSRAIRIMSGGIIVLSLFWIANTFAGAYGRGQAVADMQDLRVRPLVTLDTKESLQVSGECTSELILPRDADREYKYRYSDLRLLIKGGDRLFLISDRWVSKCPIIVVQDDDSIRVQLAT